MTISSIVEEYQAKVGSVWGHNIRVVTYRLSDKFICLIENLDVGAAICRVSAATKMDALQMGLSEAKRLVAETVPIRGDMQLELPVAMPTHIDRIVMSVDGLPVAYTIDEFNALSAQERMQYIMSGNIEFFSPSGETIPAGEAIEILRQA